jgi:hypothetical protein
MHPSLQKKIGDLASQFALGIVNLIQDQSLSMLTGGASGGIVSTAEAPAPRRARRAAAASAGGRRSPEQMAELIQQIVDAVRSNAEGLRSEQIQEKTGLAKREVVRPLQLALKQGFLRKTGEKRSTTYFVPGSEARGAAQSKSSAKSSKPAKRKAAPKRKPAAKAAPKKTAAKPKRTKAAPKRKAASKKMDKQHVNSAAAPQSEATP